MQTWAGIIRLQNNRAPRHVGSHPEEEEEEEEEGEKKKTQLIWGDDMTSLYVDYSLLVGSC